MSKLIDSWTSQIASYTNFTKDDQQVFSYSFKVLATNLTGILTLALVSLALGIFNTTMTAYLSSTSLRIFSGGIHADHPLKCMVYGLLIFCGAGLFADNIHSMVNPNILAVCLMLVMVVSGLSIQLFAPVETPNKPIKDYQVFFLKRMSLIIWGLWFIFLSLNILFNFLETKIFISFLLGILIQSLSILPYKRKKEVKL